MFDPTALSLKAKTAKKPRKNTSGSSSTVNNKKASSSIKSSKKTSNYSASKTSEEVVHLNAYSSSSRGPEIMMKQEYDIDESEIREDREDVY